MYLDGIFEAYFGDDLLPMWGPYLGAVIVWEHCLFFYLVLLSAVIKWEK